MSAPAYSLEESLERAIDTVLTADSNLATCRITSADESDEDSLPMIAIRAEKLDELVLGMQTWNSRVTITLTTSADETPDEERAERRQPDSEDDDEGAAGFKELWHDLWATVDGPNFVTNLNATDLVKVWGLEFDPVSYENETRAFRRSINFRLWVNEAYPTT
jgi:hypothetical protein